MVPNECPILDRLLEVAERSLEHIRGLTGTQVEMLDSETSHENLMEIDKQLELAFGEKERAFGALQQHVKEHRCWWQDPFNPH